jgi:hypothetical protein
MIAVSTSPDHTGRSLTARNRRYIDAFRPSDGMRLLSGSEKIHYRTQCTYVGGLRRQIIFRCIRLAWPSTIWMCLSSARCSLI